MRKEKTCKKLTNRLTMFRRCKNITSIIEEFVGVVGDSGIKVELYVDLKNEQEISELFLENRKKLFTVLNFVMSNRYDNLHYKIEYKEKNLTAMKFGHIRIICKEFFYCGKKVVLIAVEKKQSARNDKKLTNRYKIIGEYEYDFKK